MRIVEKYYLREEGRPGESIISGTLEECEKRLKELRNRNKGDKNDEYWRNVPLEIVKETLTEYVTKTIIKKDIVVEKEKELKKIYIVYEPFEKTFIINEVFDSEEKANKRIKELGKKEVFMEIWEVR